MRMRGDMIEGGRRKIACTRSNLKITFTAFTFIFNVLVLFLSLQGFHIRHTHLA